MINYDLANKRRSAHSVIKQYSLEEINFIADIGNYIDQRIQQGLSRDEALDHLRSAPIYKDFLSTTGKELSAPQAHATYLMQQGAIPGISPVVQESDKKYSKSQEACAERSLNAQVCQEQRPILEGGLEEDLAKQLA